MGNSCGFQQIHDFRWDTDIGSFHAPNTSTVSQTQSALPL